MQLHSTVENDVMVVIVAEARIDAAVAIKFKDTMREVTRDGPDRIVLDMSKVEFVDSSGLGAIVAAMKLLPKGRVLELASLTPTVDKVFRLTRMNSVFPIHADMQEALSNRAA
ncbi:STAS domain-containing protein [Pseudaestuariivita rosea]|uniref:STAS domain-containing protein n=1 Tax=Pseudaestuariivita rosea TaxID=2763263 RepID=UPI001ABA7909|nr:STAS domain-containing protein [Pseudaestuariivita rosea]